MSSSSDEEYVPRGLGFAESSSRDNPRNTTPLTLQPQADPSIFRPRIANPSRGSSYFSSMSRAHQGCLSSKLAYAIKGASASQSDPRAMFKPVVRVYLPPHSRQVQKGSSLGYLYDSPFIEHIDTTTVWKGLLLSDAERLLYLHMIFRDSLENLLTDALDNLHQDFQQQCASYHNSDIGVLIKSSLKRQLIFSLSYLVLCLNERLEHSGELFEDGWNRDFMMFLPLYLVSCDCLMSFEGDRAGDTAVEISVHYCDPSSGRIPRGTVNEAAWIPDLLSFNDIREFQREGQELIIIPRYHGNAAFTANLTRTNVEFFVESSQQWLWWDEDIGGFRGIVPLYSEMGGHLKRSAKVYGARQDTTYPTIKALRVEIKALLTAGYGSPVCLQRTIRTRLTFKVVPWFAHESACAPSDGSIRPFSFHYPECDSPAPSSRSSLFEPEVEHESPASKIIHDETPCSSNVRNSHSSLTERSTVIPNEQSPTTSPRKRRATSILTIPSPTKRQRENDKEHPVADLIDSSDAELSDPNIQAEVDKCWTRLTTPDEHNPDSARTFHNESHISSKLSALQLNSSKEDGLVNVEECEKDSKGTAAFEEDLSSLDDRRESSDLPYSNHAIHEMSNVKAIHSQKEKQAGDAEASPCHEEIFSSAQVTFSRACSLRERLGVQTSQLSRTLSQQPRKAKTTCLGEDSAGASAISVVSDDPSTLSSSKSPKSSTTVEIILENSDYDHDIRRAQAMLWNVLSLKEGRSTDQEETMCVHELKDMYAAMKLSVEEEQARKAARMDMSDVYDDVFIASGSEIDRSGDISSQPENPEASLGVENLLAFDEDELVASGVIESRSGSEDQQLAANIAV